MFVGGWCRQKYGCHRCRCCYLWKSKCDSMARQWDECEGIMPPCARELSFEWLLTDIYSIRWAHKPVSGDKSTMDPRIMPHFCMISSFEYAKKMHCTQCKWTHCSSIFYYYWSGRWRTELSNCFLSGITSWITISIWTDANIRVKFPQLEFICDFLAMSVRFWSNLLLLFCSLNSSIQSHWFFH